MKVNLLSQNNSRISYKSASNDLYSAFAPQKPYFSVEKNYTINEAIRILSNITFIQSDVDKTKGIVSKLPFRDGADAVSFLQKENIPIVFDKFDRDDIHAQWQQNRRTIAINEKYKNTTNVSEIHAISAAILHELAHAKDNDFFDSIQEELDCLSMNALAYNALKRANPELLKHSTAPIIKDGVELYSKLFFQDDKKGLIERVRSKYGNLPLESPNHEAQKIAKEIKK